jgi:hypothetical protein
MRIAPVTELSALISTLGRIFFSCPLHVFFGHCTQFSFHQPNILHLVGEMNAEYIDSFGNSPFSEKYVIDFRVVLEVVSVSEFGWALFIVGII